MTEERDDIPDRTDESIGSRFDAVCDRFEQLCRAGETPRIENLLGEWQDPHRSKLLQELLILETHYRRNQGDLLSAAEYHQRFAEYESIVSDVFARLKTAKPTPLQAGNKLETVAKDRNEQASTSDDEGSPDTIGRYQVERTLGAGGFGRVFLAYDPELKRRVAIKVPHSQLLQKPEVADLYLSEARMVAQLDHPHIVPVFDIGKDQQVPFYVVSKFIEGTTLSAMLRGERPSPRKTVGWLSQIALALHYAHEQKLTHRDVKPGNILVDKDGVPHLVDFGLALRESDIGKGPRVIGTPAYMSPEQARGEGHRVDARSDIYSLGVVLYESLLGTRPFKADSADALLERIATWDPTPLRQIDPRISPDLERICLKALSVRISDRYRTAAELAEDLQHFLQTEANVGRTSVYRPKVVPKGLRSFDEGDADFFMTLLPGPRDRDGLPDSVRFWVQRIEATDSTETFPVGLVYGPSGCGKSSLVKAAILPQLHPHVTSIYLEATGDDTEERLLLAIRERFKNLPADVNLRQALGALRRGEGLGVGRKALIVVDQFEQWLHGNWEGDRELAQALRQCDGSHVQCIVMVRDDFWMAATRFMRDLEIELVEGVNTAAVDLFSIRHAKRVLKMFGRALGCLPPSTSPLQPEHEEFVEEAIVALAHEGKVVSVQIALFADMMKDRSWTPDSLRQIGGAEGVGVTFLEETFAAKSAPPQYAQHQHTARQVLRALLPPPGTNIKGHRRSNAELLVLSECVERPEDYDALIKTLDHDLRLITPTEGPQRETEANDEGNSLHYQLTHDYLVPSLREWLNRKQRETRRGRAELCLTERAGAWSQTKDRRSLPTLIEYVSIHALTKKQQWTEKEQATMSAADRLQSVRAMILAVVLLLAALGVYEINGRIQASSHIRSLLSAEAAAVPQIVSQLTPYRSWADEHLRRIAAGQPQTTEGRRQQIHAQLALVQDDARQVSPLVTAFLSENTSIPHVAIIRDAVLPYRTIVTEDFWRILAEESETESRRFRSALALAALDPKSERWSPQFCELTTLQLVTANPENQLALRQLLQPIADKHLVEPLKGLFSDAENPDGQTGAAAALAEYVAERDQLIELAVVANPIQYKILYPRLARFDSDAVQTKLTAIVNEQLTATEAKVGMKRMASAQRRGGAAITLVRRGVFNTPLAMLMFDDDISPLPQFIHRCRDGGVVPADLLKCLDLAIDARANHKAQGLHNEYEHVLYALLLALGEFPEIQLPEDRRAAFVEMLIDWCENDPSREVHGASRWLLSEWGYHDEVRRIDHTPRDYSPGCEWFTIAIPPRAERRETHDDKPAEAQPDAVGIYLTFVVIPAGKYSVNTLSTGQDWFLLHPDGTHSEAEPRTLIEVVVEHSFAIATREITFREFELIGKLGKRQPEWDGIEHRAAVGVTWYDAVNFCRRLSEMRGVGESDQAYEDAAQLVEAGAAVDENGNLKDWPLRLNKPGFRLPTAGEHDLMRGLNLKGGAHGSDPAWIHNYVGPRGQGITSSHGPRRPCLLRPNAWGFYDTLANVNEWAHDQLPQKAGVTEPGVSRLVSNPSWGWQGPERAHNRVGFRIAVTVEPANP